MAGTTITLETARHCFEIGDLQAAETLALQLLNQEAVNVSRAPLHHLLGSIALRLGQAEKALREFQEAARLDPAWGDPHQSLGELYQRLGMEAEAMRSYARAFFCFGTVLHQHGRYQEAATSFRQVIALNPGDAAAYRSLGTSLTELNRTEQALSVYAQALELEPSDGLKVRMATRLPKIYPDLASVQGWRQRFTDAVRALSGQVLDIPDPVVSYGSPHFYLAYQGGDDRPLQETVANLFMPSIPRMESVTPYQGGRIKIGFVSRYLRQGHSIGKFFRGIIEQLPRQDFEVAVFHIESGDRALEPFEAETTLVNLPARDVTAACEQVAAAQLDILFYPDIGMEPTGYFMAMSRLAAVQCVSWGHPVTSGLSTVDYFLSSRLIEPEDAEKHYTESLVCFEHLPTWYRQPAIQASDFSKSLLKMSADQALYVCPQSLYKIHPEFDTLLCRILEQDPSGHLALLRLESSACVEALQQRFQQTMPEKVYRRIHWLESLSYPDFLGMLSAADVMLDPLYFGGGNTTYEALALGLPIVTLPGAYARSRVTMGCYAQMGLGECIVESPDDYVALAFRLGTDAAFRRSVSTAIQQRVSALYENNGFITELSAFFQRAVRKHAP